MQVRENLSMETETSTSFGNRRGFFITRTSLVLLSAFFICSVIAAGFLIYNFVTCPQIPIESSVCEHHHVVPLLTHSKNGSKTHYSKDQSHITQVKEETPYLRLPRSVIPTAYDIKLIPFIWPNNFTFLGEVRILVHILESTNNITLHAETSIKIKNEDVRVKLIVDATNGTEIPNENITKQYFESAKQFYVMEFDKKLEKDEVYEIHIKYVGVLDAYLQGFYRSSYVEGNNTK